MAFIFSTHSEVSRVDIADKVIKAKDFWAQKKAAQTIADAVSQRDSIIQAAQSAYQAETKRGYKEGWDAAKLEQSAHMIDIISQTIDYFAKVEVQMVDLVMDAVKRIASDFDDREKVLKVVRNSLSLVRNQKFITVKVNPSQMFAIESSVKDLMEAYPAIEHIDIASDPGISDDACIIESDIGRIEASMEGQIEALRATFKKVFGDPMRTGVPLDAPVPQSLIQDVHRDMAMPEDPCTIVHFDPQ